MAHLMILGKWLGLLLIEIIKMKIDMIYLSIWNLNLIKSCCAAQAPILGSLSLRKILVNCSLLLLYGFSPHSCLLHRLSLRLWTYFLSFHHQMPCQDCHLDWNFQIRTIGTRLDSTSILYMLLCLLMLFMSSRKCSVFFGEWSFFRFLFIPVSDKFQFFSKLYDPSLMQLIPFFKAKFQNKNNSCCFLKIIDLGNPYLRTLTPVFHLLLFGLQLGYSQLGKLLPDCFPLFLDLWTLHGVRQSGYIDSFICPATFLLFWVKMCPAII